MPNVKDITKLLIHVKNKVQCLRLNSGTQKNPIQYRVHSFSAKPK